MCVSRGGWVGRELSIYLPVMVARSLGRKSVRVRISLMWHPQAWAAWRMRLRLPSPLGPWMRRAARERRGEEEEEESKGLRRWVSWVRAMGSGGRWVGGGRRRREEEEGVVRSRQAHWKAWQREGEGR